MSVNYVTWDGNLNDIIQQLETHINEFNGVLNECCRNLQADMNDLYERDVRNIVTILSNEYTQSIQILNNENESFQQLSSKINEFYRVSSSVIGNNTAREKIDEGQVVPTLPPTSTCTHIVDDISKSQQLQKQLPPINRNDDQMTKVVMDNKRQKYSISSSPIQPTIRNLQVDPMQFGKVINNTIIPTPAANNDISEDMHMIRQRRLNTESMNNYSRSKRDAAEFVISDSNSSVSFGAKSNTSRSFFE